MVEICSYGCGQEGKFKLKNGKFCCSKNISGCQIFKDIKKEKQQIKWNDPNSIYNSEIIKKKISNSVKDNWKDPDSIFNTNEYREKLSKVHSERFDNILLKHKVSEHWKKYWNENEERKFKLKKDMLDGRADYLNSFPRDPEKWKKKNEKQSELMRGSNNPTWSGGTSFESYGIEFNKPLKEKVRYRDNYTCQICSKTENKLERILSIHHIDYNKKNNLEENLISLCIICHPKTNKNREQWKEKFSNK